MNITQIRNVVAVAEIGSVSGAAQHLHVAQPSVTKSIKALEYELGVPLFERGTKGMLLTVYGEAWVRRARTIQSELNRGVTELREMTEGVAGRILVAGAPLVMPRLIPRAISRTIAEHPKTHFSLIDGSGLTEEKLRDAFEQGQVDVVLSMFEPGDYSENLSCEFLFDVEIRFVVREGHPILSRELISWEDLAGFPWLGPQIGSRVRTLLDYQFRKAGLQPPHIQVETTDRMARSALLYESDMISFYSYHPACVDREIDGLQFLPIETSFKPWSIGIITRIGSELSPVTQQFLGNVRDIVADSAS